MEYDKVIKERTSCRKFCDKKLTDEDILKILNAGRISPSAKNKQPTRVIVINSDEGLSIVDSVSPCRYNAQCVMLICSNKEEAFVKNDGHSTFEMDACIFGTHMMLEATNLGIDNVWVEMFDKNNVKNVFSLDENIEPIFFLMLGYRCNDVKDSPNHLIRKEISEIVTYL